MRILPLKRPKLTAIVLCVLLSLAVLLAVYLARGAARQAPVTYKEVSWLDLVPKDWKPQQGLDRVKAASLKDGDALAKEMMRELRKVLDTAPVVTTLEGHAVRMPGYIVPLEQGKDGISEFLLVPYHGACIHTPPPPANQIVHVVSRTPVKDIRAMSAVWVQGTLRTNRKTTSMGVSGYSMELAGVEAYRPPAR